MHWLALTLATRLAEPTADAASRAPDRPGSSWTLAVNLSSSSYGFHPRGFGPGAALDAQAELIARRRWRLWLGPRVFFSSVPSFLRSVGFGALLTSGWTTPAGFTAELSLGLAYRHHLPAMRTYVVEDGVVAPTRAVGVPGFELAPSAGIGFDARPRTGVPIAALVGYEPALLAPFLPGAGVPIMMSATVWTRLRVSLDPRRWRGGRG